MEDKKVVKLSHHRNGISGVPFHVAIVEMQMDGYKRRMLVIRQSKEVDKATGAVACSVLDIDMLANGDIEYMSNSWRGDHFSDVIDEAIKAVQTADELKYGAKS